MSLITDLTAERNKRTPSAQPNPEFVKRDGFGCRMQLYGLRYEMDGVQSVSQVWAYSLEDAGQRVEAMKVSLVLDGLLTDSLPW